ncbi:MAG: hypothetical protein K9J06_05935 [Flavobacteriales bacterium]|nr:hypothetical protein [Flavobacteriales bacterium]
MMPYRQFLSLTAVAALMFSGCIAIAPPSPMVTFGGPQVTGKGVTEAVGAAGAGISFFEENEIAEHAWFGRVRQGINERWDIGIDLLGYTFEKRVSVSGKVSARYQLMSRVRLEGGIGIGDDSQGRSVNGDFGLTIGTVRPDRVWDVYGTVRYGYAHGYAGSTLDSKAAEGLIAPVHVSTVMLNLGAQARVTPHVRFIFEAGVGHLFPSHGLHGAVLYLGGGLMLRVPWRKWESVR